MTECRAGEGCCENPREPKSLSSSRRWNPGRHGCVFIAAAAFVGQQAIPLGTCRWVVRKKEHEEVSGILPLGGEKSIMGVGGTSEVLVATGEARGVGWCGWSMLQCAGHTVSTRKPVLTAGSSLTLCPLLTPTGQGSLSCKDWRPWNLHPILPGTSSKHAEWDINSIASPFSPSET